jgi:hypothetical protein
MDLRAHQAPLKERYRADPDAARITLTARGVTCQMVASSMELETRSIQVVVEGDLDLRGTLGLDRDVTPGFTEIRTRFEIDAPGASDEQLDSLLRKTERYWTVLQTLTGEPRTPIELRRAAARS